jgi:hypothetical protein
MMLLCARAALASLPRQRTCANCFKREKTQTCQESATPSSQASNKDKDKDKAKKGHANLG